MPWEAPTCVEEIGFVSARDRATGEMSVVATWAFRPSCEWMSRRSLPNKMSLDSGSVGTSDFLSQVTCAKRLFVEDNREEHVFHQHVLLESLSLDDPAQIGAVQLIKSAAHKALKLN